MQKIRVLHLIEKLNKGGLEKTLLTISERMNKEKFYNEILCITDLGSYGDEVVKKKLVTTNIDCAYLNSYHNPKNILKLASIIKKKSIDILHTYGYFANVFGHLASFFLKIIKVEKIPSSYFKEYKKKHLIAERILSYFTNKIICPSYAVKQWIVDTIKINPKKVIVIYNPGVGPEKKYNIIELKNKFGIHPDDFVISTLARLTSIKSIDKLILAAKEFNNIKFLIAGEGEEEKNLKMLVKDNNLKNVIFTGWIEDVGEILSITNIFVLLSKIREGFSSSISNALGFGIPVIATDVGGNKEAIIDNFNGFLIPVDGESGADLSKLISAIKILFQDEKKRFQFGKNAQKIFNEKFNISIILKQIENLYIDLYKRCVESVE